MQNRRVLAGLALVVSLLFGLVAAGGPAQAQRRHFCGIVRVRPGACIIVRGRTATRTDFDISGARPRPRRGTTIAGWGLDRGLSRCPLANRRLSNVTWRRVSACPQAR